jgi:hypothetical protein
MSLPNHLFRFDSTYLLLAFSHSDSIFIPAFVLSGRTSGSYRCFSLVLRTSNLIFFERHLKISLSYIVPLLAY